MGYPSPILTLLPLNGSLGGRDRVTGSFTATGTGALRWAPAENARVNYFTNPRLALSQGSWSIYNPGGLTTLTGVRDTSIGCFGSTSYKVTFTGLDNPEYFAVNVSAGNRVSIPDLSKSYIVKYAVWVSPTIAGRVAVNIQNNAYNRDDTYVGIVGGGVNMSSTGSLTLTATSPSTPQIISKSLTSLPSLDNIRSLLNIYAGAGESNIAGDIWIGGCWFEELSTAGDYFDGSFPGCSWLDPRTGQLGSAHASPSCNQLTAWIEEGTTNLFYNPVAANNVVGAGVTAPQTLSRDTTTAYFGATSYKIDGSGTDSNRIVFSSISSLGYTGSTKTFTGSVYMKGSGTFKSDLTIFYTDASTTQGTFSTSFSLTNSWQRIVAPSITSDPAKTVNYITISIRYSGTQAASTYYCNGAQIEEKSYATSFCSGDLGTGYSWAGTAHASSSTRVAGAISFPHSGRVDTVKGAVLAKAQPVVGPPGINRDVWRWGSSTGDLHVYRIGTDFAATSYWNISNAGNKFIGTPAATWAISNWNKAYASWSGTQQSIRKNDNTLLSTTRDSPTGTIAGTDIAIGYNLPSLNNYLDGCIGPLAIFSRELTDAERTAYNSRIDNFQDLWSLYEQAVGGLVRTEPDAPYSLIRTPHQLL